jgi:hypothetical protein
VKGGRRLIAVVAGLTALTAIAGGCSSGESDDDARGSVRDPSEGAGDPSDTFPSDNFPSSTSFPTTTFRPTTTSTSPTTTSTIPTTTTTTGPPDDETRLEECEQRAGEAEVTFEPSRDMTVDETERVVVVAAVNPAGQATTTVTFETSTTVVSIRLRCEVRAQLRGAGFEIVPEDFQGGSFLDRPSIRWSWDVTPTKEGDRSLTLEVQSVAHIGGDEIEGAGGELFEAEIAVDAKPRSTMDRVGDMAGGFVSHPVAQLMAWVAAVGTLVLAVPAVAKRLSQSNEKTTVPPPQSNEKTNDPPRRGARRSERRRSGRRG